MYNAVDTDAMEPFFLATFLPRLLTQWVLTHKLVVVQPLLHYRQGGEDMRVGLGLF